MVKWVLPLTVLLALVAYWFWPYGEPGFYQNCVDRVNKLRAMENPLLQPLTRDRGREGCSNDDARINFEKGAHTSVCLGAAQNECSPRSSAKDILDICFEKEMYQQEKPCYKNCSLQDCPCYLNPACMCGHYVNMTDKFNPHTRVACGLYRTPAGLLKAVINFW